MERQRTTSTSSISSSSSSDLSDGERTPSPVSPPTRDVAVQISEYTLGQRDPDQIFSTWAHFQTRANQLAVENCVRQEEIEVGLRQEDDDTPTLAMPAREYLRNIRERLLAVQAVVRATRRLMAED
ncbi:unnamed protein product [Caenorhabditis brenneri]